MPNVYTGQGGYVGVPWGRTDNDFLSFFLVYDWLEETNVHIYIEVSYC